MQGAQIVLAIAKPTTHTVDELIPCKHGRDTWTRSWEPPLTRLGSPEATQGQLLKAFCESYIVQRTWLLELWILQVHRTSRQSTHDMKGMSGWHTQTQIIANRRAKRHRYTRFQAKWLNGNNDMISVNKPEKPVQPKADEEAKSWETDDTWDISTFLPRT